MDLDKIETLAALLRRLNGLEVRVRSSDYDANEAKRCLELFVPHVPTEMAEGLAKDILDALVPVVVKYERKLKKQLVACAK